MDGQERRARRFISENFAMGRLLCRWRTVRRSLSVHGLGRNAKPVLNAKMLRFILCMNDIGTPDL